MGRTSRVRTRDTNIVGQSIGYPLSGGPPTIIQRTFMRQESFTDFLSSPRTFNPCTHWKVTKRASGYVGTTSTHTNYTKDWCDEYFHYEPCADIISNIFTDQLETLEFQANNDFQLLNLLGELDDTIAMFTVKFWKELSYGAFNWGILPFVSDLKSLYRSLDDIFGGKIFDNIDELNRKKRSTYNVSYVKNYKHYSYKFDGKLRLTGDFSVTLPPSQHLEILLLADELGVHPDIRTIWDLIPLSFVVDYFLPVGDILESLHPRGWAKFGITFSGEYSISGKVTTNVIYPNSLQLGALAKAETSLFHRGEGKNINLSPVPKIDYKFGLSLRQLFNLGYLANKFRV